jgi:proteic killer suppression protein
LTFEGLEKLKGAHHVSEALSCVAVLPLDSITAMRYYLYMIKGFADKETEKLWRRERSKAVPTQLQRVALRKLTQLHISGRLDDLRVPPGNKLEQLSGNRKGQHSIRINDQYRVCFVWDAGDAYDVEVTDYHH